MPPSYGNGGENTIVKTDKPDIPSDRYGKTLSDDIVYANALSIAGGDVGVQYFDILKNGDILACSTSFGTVLPTDDPFRDSTGRR